MLQSDSTQTIDHIQKCFRHKYQCQCKRKSVREGRHTRPPYFFIGGGAEATSRSNPLFKIEPCIFISMTLLPIQRRIQRPTTQGHSIHAKYENSRKIIFIFFHFLRYP